MGIALVAASIVCLTSTLAYIGLASIIVIALIEFHAHVSSAIGVVPVITIRALVIVATCTAFKLITGQVLSGRLLSLSH